MQSSSGYMLWMNRSLKIFFLSKAPHIPPRPSTREIHTRQVLWKSPEGPASNLSPVATFLLYVICLQPYSGLSGHLHFLTPVETNRLLLHTWSIGLWEGDKGARVSMLLWSGQTLPLPPSSSPWSPIVILEVVSHHLCYSILYLKIIDLLIWPQYQLTVEQKLTWWFFKSCATLF